MARGAWGPQEGVVPQTGDVFVLLRCREDYLSDRLKQAAQTYCASRCSGRPGEGCLTLVRHLRGLPGTVRRGMG